MKFLFSVAVLFLCLSASAQYYYKDIVSTRESSVLLAAYRKNNVQTVTIKSYTVNNIPLENLTVQQVFSPLQQTLRTLTQSGYLAASVLTTWFNADNRVLKTTDSTNGFVTTTLYTYNEAGQITTITTSYGDPQAALQSDEHLWKYNAQNNPVRMLRVKNKKDTSVVNLKLDDAGNVVEEQETIRFLKEEPVYYFYDAKNRLTDIVRYNKKAARLLPEQMFEYATNNLLVQRTTIPQNSSQYLIWRYRFDSRGLKTREEIYDKQKELTGRVDYQYTFGQ